MEKSNQKKICVIGLGYIGLPTASLLATKGYQVTGVDINPTTIETINQGKIHIHEPDLDILVRSAVGSGNLKASLQPQTADVFILAVPTPFKDNHQPNLDYVSEATKSILPFLKAGDLVILESTSPVGTTEMIGDIIRNNRPDLSVPKWTPFKKQDQSQGLAANDKTTAIYLAHCPERVLPGKILSELVMNDRVVGGIDKNSAQMAGNFYKSFVSGQVFECDSRTAELTKLTENSFRDVNIAFANELSLICDRLGIDVWNLIRLANKHPRVKILNPGPGVGGHCIAVDPWFIVSAAPNEARLIRTAREVNDFKPEHVVGKILHLCSELKDPRVACLGLSFKGNIDDLRESPSIEIVKNLSEKLNGKIVACEPHVEKLPTELESIENIAFTKDPVFAISNSNVVVLLVDHNQFLNLDRKILSEKIVYDTRGVL